MDNSYTISNVSEYISIISSIPHQEDRIEEEQFDNLRYLSYGKDIPRDLAQYFDVLLANKKLDDERQVSIDDYEYVHAPKEPRYKYYFRGHYKSSYKMCPSVFRENYWQYEDYFYHRIIVERAESFRNASHLDKLVTMQHYSCPTRLLDVTSNPLVALYFACKNYGCDKCNQSDEGVVLVFPVLTRDISYADSDRALMLSCLPRFSSFDKDKLLQSANDHLASKRFPQIKGGSRYNEDVVERFYHEITTEIASFKREIDPIDLLQPLFIQPNKTNGRIIKQDGAFIINGLSKDRQEAEQKLDALTYTRIYIKNQSKILKELEMLGIHEASLFPEVDKMADYLKDSVKNYSPVSL